MVWLGKYVIKMLFKMCGLFLSQKTYIGVGFSGVAAVLCWWRDGVL